MRWREFRLIRGGPWRRLNRCDAHPQTQAGIAGGDQHTTIASDLDWAWTARQGGGIVIGNNRFTALGTVGEIGRYANVGPHDVSDANSLVEGGEVVVYPPDRIHQPIIVGQSKTCQLPDRLHC